MVKYLKDRYNPKMKNDLNSGKSLVNIINNSNKIDKISINDKLDNKIKNILHEIFIIQLWLLKNSFHLNLLII